MGITRLGITRAGITRAGITRRRAVSVATGLLLAVLPLGAAHGEPVEKHSEHSTNIGCETYTDGLTIAATLNRSIDDDGLSMWASADLFNDDETVYATGETSELTFGDGVFRATVELADHDGEPYGTALLEGTYEVGEPHRVPGRPLLLEGNQVLVGSQYVASVAVDWQTLSVAGVDLVVDGVPQADLSCGSYDLQTSGMFTAPHRYSIPIEGYAVTGPCAPAPLTEVVVVPSEVGLSLLLVAEGDVVGSTNVDPATSDPGFLEWWLPGQDDPVVAPITVALENAGSPTTTVAVEDGRTIRTTTRPLLMTFTAGLADGGTVTAACDVEHTTARIVVEPA